MPVPLAPIFNTGANEWLERWIIEKKCDLQMQALDGKTKAFKDWVQRAELDDHVAPKTRACRIKWTLESECFGCIFKSLVVSWISNAL